MQENCSSEFFRNAPGESMRRAKRPLIEPGEGPVWRRIDEAAAGDLESDSEERAA